jgi:hypothetical protein
MNIAELSPTIIEAIDSHACLAQVHRRLHQRGHEQFVNHSCIAATLAVDQGIASDVPLAYWNITGTGKEAA